MKQWQRKELVRKFRKQGLSYKEIQNAIKIAKSTLSLWCQDIPLSPQQKIRLGLKYDIQLRGAKANKAKREKQITAIKNKAKTEITTLRHSEFKIAGLMLYWAEGNKTLYPGVTNSDPDLIKFMMKWFREICLVPNHKFKIHLHLHTGQDENAIKIFWSKITNIPLSRFGKSHIKKRRLRSQEKLFI